MNMADMKVIVLPLFLIVFMATTSSQTAIGQAGQNWTSYKDPILGIQFEYPSSWYMDEDRGLTLYPYGDPAGQTEVKYIANFANVSYFLPPVPGGSLLDKFMRQRMMELRSDQSQNITVNRTSTIGADNIPAIRVEYNNVIGDMINSKNIHYFAIDNSTDTAYVISLVADNERVNEFLPSFEKVVDSFKFS
jgi:hypothetical protein